MSPIYYVKKYSATKSTVADSVDFVADTVDFVAGFGNKSATTWIWQLVAVDIVANYVANVYWAFECSGNYSAASNNNEVGTLAVDGWVVTFGTARRGLDGAAARPGPSSLYQI